MSDLNAFPIGPEGESVAERQRRLFEDRQGHGAMTSTEDEVETLRAAGRAEQIRIAREKAWDACLDAIEQNELNTEQAREGNPYRKVPRD